MIMRTAECRVSLTQVWRRWGRPRGLRPGDFLRTQGRLELRQLSEALGLPDWLLVETEPGQGCWGHSEVVRRYESWIEERLGGDADLDDEAFLREMRAMLDASTEGEETLFRLMEGACGDAEPVPVSREDRPVRCAEEARIGAGHAGWPEPFRTTSMLVAPDYDGSLVAVAS
jgi:hypothetical protein